MSHFEIAEMRVSNLKALHLVTLAPKFGTQEKFC